LYDRQNYPEHLPEEELGYGGSAFCRVYPTSRSHEINAIEIAPAQINFS
jgi:hypothetical protein